MSDENKAIARRFFDEVVSQGRLELIDEMVDADMIDHEAFPGIPQGREGVKEFVTMFRNAFDALQFSVEDMIAEGDRVAARVTISGTHNGQFLDLAPTGKQISINAIDILRFANGKAVEHWGVTDQMGMMQQLGAIPE